MKTLPICVLLFLLSFLAAAQKTKVITYAQTISISQKDIDSVITEGVEEKENISDSFTLATIKGLKELAKQMNKQEDLLEAWREGDEVVTREPNNDEGKIYKYYNVHTLSFRVIDSFTYKKINKIDTFTTSLDPKLNPEWEVTYSITKSGKRKKILQYDCTLYTIVQTRKSRAKEEKAEKTTIDVWATTKIKPSLSTHALLGLYSKVLAHVTPLEVEVHSHKSPDSLHYMKAIGIK